MPSCRVSIVAWTSVVPVIGEMARRRIRYRGSYCGGQDAAGVGRQGEVAADVLVGVVVEVVLDADPVEVHGRVGGAVVGLEVDLVVQAVDVEQLALDPGIGLPGHHVGPGPDGPPEAAQRLAADLVVPADGLALDIGDDPEDVELDRQVDLVAGERPAGLERAAGVRDRVERDEREDVRVVHLAGRVRVRVVDAGVLIVGEEVAQERVAQAVVVELGEPLGVGVPVLEVRLGMDRPRACSRCWRIR